MTDAPKLPADLADALTKWADEKGLTRDEAAAAVRAALPLPDSFEPGLSTATGEGRLITTEVSYVTVAFQTPPARFSEALEYTNEFHPDGRMATAGEDTTDATKISMAVGERRNVGEWEWTAGPLALVGVRIPTRFPDTRG